MRTRWRRLEAALLSLVVLVLLYAGLTPFDLARRNGVAWDRDGQGLVFDGGGIAFSRGTFQLEDPAREMTLELWVQAGDAPAWREGTILSFVDERAVTPLALTTRYGSVTLRYRLAQDGIETTRAISMAQALERSEARHVAITSGAGGTRVYVDGRAPDSLRSRQSLVDPRRGFRGQLILGNSPQGYSGWVGELQGLALYERALGEAEIAEHALRIAERGARSLLGEAELRALYAFDAPGARLVPNLVSSEGAISVPSVFEAQRLEVLMFPPPVSPLRSPRFLQDILLNLLGFVPLGVLLVWVLGRPGTSEGGLLALASGVGGLISLVIELGQALLPTRYSSVLDLALNVVGTALGALLALAWVRIRARRSGQKPGQTPG